MLIEPLNGDRVIAALVGPSQHDRLAKRLGGEGQDDRGLRHETEGEELLSLFEPQGGDADADRDTRFQF